ncbi:hypothetical protein DESACE_02655 [Desulfurella acetivorans A63]|nr:hypothetical protein DESACE_02655 [Desulfurella acetivorans A63]
MSPKSFSEESHIKHTKPVVIIFFGIKKACKPKNAYRQDTLVFTHQST